MLDGAVTVMEVLAVPPTLELEELELEELELMLTEVELEELELEDIDVLEDMDELDELELEELVAFVPVAAAPTVGVVLVAVSPPQAARVADNEAMTHTAMRLKKIPLKVSYIAYSPVRQNTRRSRWCGRRELGFHLSNNMSRAHEVAPARC